VKTIKVAVGLPWYDGADKDCVGAFLAFQHYLGRLQERLWWLNHSKERGLPPPVMPKLDIADPTGETEIPEWLVGTNIEFLISDEIGVSLPGMARERVIDMSLRCGADYILFWDADMLFTDRVFFQLLQHKKPVVAALAFTAREPIAPVLYSFRDHTDTGPQITTTVDPIFEYKRNSLIQVDAVGFGVVMVQASVFRRIPKPWFNNPGIGEDIQFSIMCKRYGIPIFADTSARVIHKPRYHKEWHGEEVYLLSRDPEYQAAVKVLAKIRDERLAELVKKETA
jgi:hypothetical protein